MKFLDRVKLLLRATVGGALGGGLITPTRGERFDRLRDEARAQLEALRRRLTGAEERGDEASARRLRQAIAELQRLLDDLEARQRVAPSPPLAVTEPASVPAEQKQTAPDAPPASAPQLDETRIAEHIRKLRERRGE